MVYGETSDKITSETGEVIAIFAEELANSSVSTAL
jgi:hypothetical protein